MQIKKYMLVPEKLKECNICYDKKEDFMPCKQCKINVCLGCFKKINKNVSRLFLSTM